jgi:hypothetical protein
MANESVSTPLIGAAISIDHTHAMCGATGALDSRGFVTGDVRHPTPDAQYMYGSNSTKRIRRLLHYGTLI